jgi:Tfp pilus assembly protein PilO
MLKQSLPYTIALVVLIMLFSLFGYPLFKKAGEADKLLVNDFNTLKKIYSSPNLPSSELINVMEEENRELKGKYENLMEKLPASKEFSIPEGVNLPLFFLEEFKKVKGRIGAKASEKRVQVLTEDFGLLNTLPSEKEAPQLIRNLYITEIIVNLLLDVGVESIDAIELGAAQGKDIYEDVPLNLKVKCDTPALTNLLFTLENTDNGFFIVRDFSITSTMTTKGMTAASPTRNQPSNTREVTGTESEKIVQVDLTLSIIRWE